MKLALASCAKLQSTNPQPVWAEIQTERPDARLLLGDTVYLNHDRHDDPAALGAELRALYAAQLAKPNFAHLLNDLRARGAQVLAIYDDHEFLGNNRYAGDHSAALRESACVEFIRAFAPPQTGQNVYHLRRVASRRACRHRGARRALLPPGAIGFGIRPRRRAGQRAMELAGAGGCRVGCKLPRGRFEHDAAHFQSTPRAGLRPARPPWGIKESGKATLP